MTGAARVLRGDHVALVVTDLAAAVDWYTEHLGLDVTDRWADAALEMEWAHLRAPGVCLELVQRTCRADQQPDTPGYHHLAVVVADCAAATEAVVQAGGAAVHGPASFDRHQLDWSFVTDPFGNVLELISYRPTGADST